MATPNSPLPDQDGADLSPARLGAARRLTPSCSCRIPAPVGCARLGTVPAHTAITGRGRQAKRSVTPDALDLTWGMP
jgi:hypothetical protein